MSTRKIKISIFFMLAVFFLVYVCSAVDAFEKIITIAAEDPHGIELDLEKGEYIAAIEGGAVSLFYPINPNYCWLIGVAVGVDAEGGQDEPDIGTLYFEPDPAVESQFEAEQKALEAVQKRLSGTYLRFSLNEPKKVRFWVSDFDYSDNSGMVKVRIAKI